MNRRFLPPAVAMVVCWLLAACVDLHGVAVDLNQSDATAPPSITIARDVDFRLSTGYDRTLRRGTVWLAAGSVAAGQVYRPRDTVFTVEATNVHEAYLVLAAGKLVGYYLPVERTYFAESRPFTVPIQ